MIESTSKDNATIKMKDIHNDHSLHNKREKMDGVVACAGQILFIVTNQVVDHFVGTFSNSDIIAAWPNDHSGQYDDDVQSRVYLSIGLILIDWILSVIKASYLIDRVGYVEDESWNVVEIAVIPTINFVIHNDS